MGRLVIHLGLLLDFIVDPDSSDYPQDSLAKCPQCAEALSLELTTLLSLNVANIDPATIRPLLLSASLQEFSVKNSVFDNLDPVTFQALFNDLIKAAVPIVDGLLAKGFSNPLVGQYGISAIQLRLTEELALISVETQEQH